PGPARPAPPPAAHRPPSVDDVVARLGSATLGGDTRAGKIIAAGLRAAQDRHRPRGGPGHHRR
ncbi:MAG: hypothetical protein HY906_16095, partial [Deltaproteobacteria bacterium]|nr:hypothetical protein [Deltaproteobacteria bacterium]